jgi:hypothetical protein
VALGNKRVFWVEPGDLVISNVFAWEGAIAVAANDEAGKIGSHRFMTYTPADDRIHIPWAAWFFRSERGLGLIRKASPGSAGRNRTLAIHRFESLEIPLPPVAEQRRVAEHLNRVENAATLAASAFDARGSEFFVRHLPGLLGAVMERSATDRTAVSELVDFVSDIVHPGDDPSPADCFIGLQHVESHTGQRVGADDLELFDGRKFRFRPGDVIYGYLRPYLNKVWVADRFGLCSVDQYVLRPRPEVNPYLLGYLLRSEAVLRQARQLTHNLQLPRLRSGLLASVEVSVIRREDVPSLLQKLDRIRELIAAIADARSRQDQIAGSLVAAATNEAFAAQD